MAITMIIFLVFIAHVNLLNRVQLIFLNDFWICRTFLLNPTVQEWVVNTGRESTVKSFLRGHQKSGPFLEDNDSAIRVKRLSGLKSVSSKDKVQVIIA